MNGKRIVFLLLTVIVAGATAFMAHLWLQAERTAMQRQTAPVNKPAVQALIARNVLCIGQIIKPEDLRWQPRPQGAEPRRNPNFFPQPGGGV